MIDKKREIVPGLTSADVKEIADQIFNRTDGNHPQLHQAENGFLDILQNGKADISSSPVFVKKVAL
jgi:hypothetical protein